MNISSVGHSFATHSYAARSEQSGADKPEYKKPEKDAALSPEQLKEVEKLKARDREVRAHEMAHLAAAGGLATSGASFSYQRGPDGVSYAVGGEVKIDTSSGSNPEETLRKAQIIRAAALAPAEPSGQDRAVAAKASQMEAQARAEQAAVERDEQEPSAEDEKVQSQNNANQQAAVQQYQSAAAGFDNAPQLQLQA
ncbi:putative metalloprotease CJM1_0395 family protein [Thiopseudomonas acetoxidans]|uniref:Metalloprotease CJM1_0395 family protein n=1 Tax=Thiopseudomonas acetoxidans TaxID=3041622 RepID=A0ABT7SQZ8_9GAMM|nr:putative metalloprotease CJM1_0395 family protein [Thiopseudomonas sp. CY1220]MDM7858590.1 putative metalloprotease CJM1_0395 family protein [Thiopseudomonas sp. CY1220]